MSFVGLVFALHGIRFGTGFNKDDDHDRQPAKHRQSRQSRAAFALFVLVGTMAGCPVFAQNPPDPTRIPFDPANFVDPTLSTNLYHPTRPGTQWIRAGTTEVGSRKVPHMVISTMTDVIRTIDGVQAGAMLDQSTDSAEISQVGFDYLALDKDGNIWIMGGYTEEFEGGVFTNVENAFLGTETGGAPGILMPAAVTMVTPRWYIGTPGPEEPPSVAEPVEVGITTIVPFGTYENVLAVRERSIGEIDNEVKFYAPAPDTAFFAAMGQILGSASLADAYKFASAGLLDLLPAGVASPAFIPPFAVLALAAFAALIVAWRALTGISMAQGDYNV